MLALLLTWLPPATDCGGGPLLDLAGYRVEWMTRACWNVETDYPSCEMPVLRSADLPADATSWSGDLSDPPAVGQATYWHLLAVDAAGNRSDECLP